MTTERYRVTLDRGACDGVFACLVRDDRFVEAADGLATLDGQSDAGAEPRTEVDSDAELDSDADARTDDAVSATFDDDRRDGAEQAAAACPVDAVSVEVLDGE